MGLKRPSSKVENKVAKKPAAKVTKVAKFKKPAAQTGKKGILKEKKKEVEKDNGEEGEEEEMLTDDEVVHTDSHIQKPEDTPAAAGCQALLSHGD